MPTYPNPNISGILSAFSNRDGYGVRIRWATAYPEDKDNLIAYNIYYSTNDDYTYPENLFLNGPQFISLNGLTFTDILDLVPGQMYFFGVRAVEYDPTISAPEELSTIFEILKAYPSGLLREDIDNTSLIIPLIDIEGFPTKGYIKVGAELIKYSSVDLALNNILADERGSLNTNARFHDTDGNDGYHTWNANILYYTGTEDQNTKNFQCQNRFDYPEWSFTLSDGYKQKTKDILTTDLSGSDAVNQNFPTYDYSSYHMTDPVALLNGDCVGSYIGGEQGCVDGYDGVGRVLRGISVADQNAQRQEILLDLIGEPVCLFKKRRTGVVCNCYIPSSEYPDDRCPKCFIPGTLVRSEEGWKPIEQIKIGEKILSSDGLYHKVLQTHINQYDGMLNSILSSVSTNPILCTPEHPFLVMRGEHTRANGCGPKCDNYIKNGNNGSSSRNQDITLLPSGKWHARVTLNYKRNAIGSFNTYEEAQNAVNKYKLENIKSGHVLEWDYAENIKEKDWLVAKWNNETIDINEIVIPEKFTKSSAKRKGKTKFKVDEEFLWIIGMYIAEGCAGKRSISFGLNKNEINFRDRIIKFFCEYGYNPKIYKRGKNGVCIEIYSTTLSQWLPELVGKYCYNKKIPSILMQLPINKLKTILKGIYDGDGSKRDNEITQTSEILALQLTELLHRIGEQPLVRKQISNVLTPKGNKRKDAYCVSWANEGIKNNNRRGRWIFGNEILSKVKSIKKVEYSGLVYNLEVEDTHDYVVQGIVTHNCHGQGIVVGYEQYFNPRRSDGRILVRFNPVDEILKPNETGLESEVLADCWALMVPTIKDRDFIIRFDEEDNEEFRYEVTTVGRNKLLSGSLGAQKFRAARVRKTDPIYQVPAFRNTAFFPTTIYTSVDSSIGFPPHSHSIVINENVSDISQINQVTSVAMGHSHVVRNGIVLAHNSVGSPQGLNADSGLGHRHLLNL